MIIAGSGVRASLARLKTQSIKCQSLEKFKKGYLLAVYAPSNLSKITGTLIAIKQWFASLAAQNGLQKGGYSC
jgi:hypothetical protein